MENEKRNNPAEIQNIQDGIPQPGSDTDVDESGLIQMQGAFSAYSGPIPPPQALRDFEEVCPGLADRIVKMAEKTQDANIRDIDNRHRETTIGQISGLVATLSMAAVAIVALLKNFPSVAGIVCSTTIVALATVFLVGKKYSAKKE